MSFLAICGVNRKASIANNDNKRVMQTMLYFKHVAILRSELFRNKSV